MPLAIRIGQMNARVIRLDALGRRLTEMADLEDGEFDFNSEPAMGGPEEPDPTGSAVAVPEVLTAMAQLNSQLDNREAQLGVLESVILNQEPVGSGLPAKDVRFSPAGCHHISAVAQIRLPVSRRITRAWILQARPAPKSSPLPTVS